jgi:rhodanese-related sulfurtransferase
MNMLFKSTIFAMAIAMLVAIFPAVSWAEEDPEPYCINDIPNENRRGICGDYLSEISPAEAFLDTVVNRGKWSSPSQRPVIIDVRSTPEYKAGHPEHAYNVPSPFIYQYCNAQDDGVNRTPDGACISGGDRIAQPGTEFVSYVESIIPDKDTPIYTMCRTGVRSVGAAELLKNAGYTHVRNIWEGFVGIYLTAPFQDYDAESGEYVVGPVDLNHDGELTDEDKNGWRNHQGLPYETRLLPKLIYQDYAETYDWD